MAVALALTLLNYSWWKFGADDAYITFRYAKNLAEGHGFVYNLGDRVLGTTSPFFALLLAVIYRVVPVDLPWIAEVLGGVAAGLAAAVFGSLLRDLLKGENPRLPGALATVFPLLFLMNPMLVRISGMGMEAPVFYLLLLLTFRWHQAGRHGLCALAGLCLTLTRPEGAVFMALLFVWDYGVLRSRERERGALFPYFFYAILLGGWLVFSKAYFHTWIPTSIEAKKIYFGNVIRYGETTRAEIEDAAFGGPWNAAQPLLSAWNRARMLLLVLGAALLAVRRRPETLFVGFMFASVGYLYVERMRIFPWYLAPSYLVGYLLLAVVAGCGLRKLRPAGAVVAAGALMLAAGGFFTWEEIARTAKMQPVQHQFFKAAAEEIVRRKGPDSVVFAEEIGIVGYYSGVRIEDWGGLVSPDLFPYIRKADLKGAMEAANGDFVVFARAPGRATPFADPAGAAWFQQHYETVFEREVIAGRRIYTLYQRRERRY